MFSKMLMVAATVALAADAAAGQRGQSMRFQAMDRDRDGRISRAEWTGSDRAFEAQDWNGDGVLAGEEVRPSIRRDNDRVDAPNAAASTHDDWSEQAFSSLDRNGDGRLTSVEWSVDQAAFRRADHNGDGIVTRREFLGERESEDVVDDAAAAAEAMRFDRLDANRDDRISRDEWRDSRAAFDRLDENRDGRLTRGELLTDDAADGRFDQLDADRNGAVTRGEWTGSASSFSRLDVNRDGGLTRAELARETGAGTVGTVGDVARDAARSPAYRAGYERGLADGRLAGREDRQRNQGFDLDGQRELENADAGFDGRVGSRADYQTGYRAAFQLAYREGYGAR
ncbi:MAG: hypothetical protein ABIT71_19315 [Vicinamibacteraceae bacterium]